MQRVTHRHLSKVELTFRYFQQGGTPVDDGSLHRHLSKVELAFRDFQQGGTPVDALDSDEDDVKD